METEGGGWTRVISYEAGESPWNAWSDDHQLENGRLPWSPQPWGGDRASSDREDGTDLTYLIRHRRSEDLLSVSGGGQGRSTEFVGVFDLDGFQRYLRARHL